MVPPPLTNVVQAVMKCIFYSNQFPLSNYMNNLTFLKDNQCCDVCALSIRNNDQLNSIRRMLLVLLLSSLSIYFLASANKLFA